MPTSTSKAITWILLFIVIYVLFLIKDKNGNRYTALGTTLLVMNSLAGFYLADEVSAWIAFIVTGVFFLNVNTMPKD